MANHTGANPEEGTLDKETLKSFFGYSGPEDALVHTPGTERIPENCMFILQFRDQNHLLTIKRVPSTRR
jgi:hypothetical protein